MYYVVYNMYQTKDQVAMNIRELVCWSDDDNLIRDYISDKVALLQEYGVEKYECDWMEFLAILNTEYDINCGDDENQYKLQVFVSKLGIKCMTTKYWINALMREGDVVDDLLTEMIDTVYFMQLLYPYMRDGKKIKAVIDYITVAHLSHIAYDVQNCGGVHNSSLDILALLNQRGYI